LTCIKVPRRWPVHTEQAMMPAGRRMPALLERMNAHD
jgi:hypothetical protein